MFALHAARYVLVVLAALAAASLWSCARAADLPDPKLTSGAVDPALTAARLCSPGFRTGAVRGVTQAVKRRVYAEYGVSCRPGERTAALASCSDWEVDHLVSLEIGGSNDIANLWPQSYQTTPWNAHVKDRLENKLHVVVCSGGMKLADAQACIRTDWVACYRRVFGP